MSLAQRVTSAPSRPNLLPRQVCGQILKPDANRVTDAQVRELAYFAEAVDSRGAHVQELGDLADGKQGLPRTPAGKLL